MEPLFLEVKKSGLKLAVGSQMPVNDAEWPAAVLGELYKQAPYTESSYQTEIRFDEKDAERGNAYGRVLVYSKTTMPESAAIGTKGQAAGVQYVQIPFIIRDFKLAPLDLIMLSNTEFRPQNRKRLRDALFRPGVAEGIDAARWNTLLNIDRYPLGLGGLPLDSLNTQILPYDKFGSVHTGDILTDLSPLDGAAHAEMTAAFDDWCAAKLASPGMDDTRAQLKKIAELTTADGRRVSLAEYVPPTVIQVTRKHGAVYHVKRANADAYAPVEQDFDRAQAQQVLGPDTVKAVDETGLVAVNSSPVVRSDLVEEKVEPIKDFGLWRVKAADGTPLLGIVFPKVVDLDGTTLPTQVFTNGSQNAIQQQIVGVRAGAVTDLPAAKVAKGPGVFYRQQSGTEVLALIPLTVEVSSEDEQGLKVYEVTKMTGERMRLHATPGAIGVQEIGEGEYMVPGDLKFLPLPNEGHVQLLGSAEDFVKIGHARRDALKLTYHGHDSYSVDGCGLDKLGSRAHRYIGPEDALFLMATAGMHPEFAVTKLARARDTGVVTIPKLRSITTLDERLVLTKHALAKAEFAKWAAMVPRPRWLVKEALILNDPQSLDKLLGLGFINPHNVSVFISYLPEFERTLGKVCQILFMARLGEPEGSELEAAAERAMHGLESMISGLELIGLELQSDSDSG